MDWFSAFDPSHIWDLILSQTPTPTKPPEIELLKSQLEFLKDTNTRLGESFNRFVGAMQFTLVAFAFLGALLAYVFGKNLDDAKKVASQMVKQEVQAKVQELVQTEIDSLKRTLRREQVISSTIVDYYLPSLDGEPSECKLLKTRGFQNVQFWNERKAPSKLSGDVCVLDLENFTDSSGKKFAELPPDKRENQAKANIDEILQLLPYKAILVIYTRTYVQALNTSVPKDRYFAPANTPITLMGMVADAAYVAYGEERI